MNPLDRWLSFRLGSVPTPEKFSDWRDKAVRAVVSHAASHSPFYAEKFHDISLDAEKLDMGILPRTSQDELRTDADRFLCGSRDDVARIVTLNSSGTTGNPKRVFQSADDLEHTVSFFEYGMQLMVAAGDVVLILLPGGSRGGVGDLLVSALNRFGADGIVHGPVDDAEKTIELMQREHVTGLVGSPAHCNLLAVNWEAERLPKGQVKSALLCWDAVPEAVKNNVRNAFGCRTYCHWGMVETGLGGAVSCDEGTSMHLREADLYVEVADSDDGSPVPDGTAGEILVTTLSRRVMPLIRYQTGDLGVIDSSLCVCGTPLRRLRLVGERIISRSGGIPFGALNEMLYATKGVGDFLLSQNHDSGVFTLQVSVLKSLQEHACNILERYDFDSIVGASVRVETISGNQPAEPGLRKRSLRRETVKEGT